MRSACGGLAEPSNCTVMGGWELGSVRGRTAAILMERERGVKEAGWDLALPPRSSNLTPVLSIAYG
jgi:hypothetical protein